MSRALTRVPSKGGVLVDRLTRDAAHGVDAELEAEVVDRTGEWPEPLATSRRGKAVDRRQQPAESVHLEGDERPVDRGSGLRLVPLDVDHDVLPAVRSQMRGHVRGALDHLVLGDTGAVDIPAVPAHRGRRCGSWRRHRLTRGQGRTGRDAESRRARDASSWRWPPSRSHAPSRAGCIRGSGPHGRRGTAPRQGQPAGRTHDGLVRSDEARRPAPVPRPFANRRAGCTANR